LSALLSRHSAQAKDGTSAAAGHNKQLQRTVARLTAQLKAAEASQAQQQAYVQQLAQELQTLEQQQQQGGAAGGAAGVQMTAAAAAAADVARRPTAGSDAQELFLQVRKAAKCHTCVFRQQTCGVVTHADACVTNA
jgi:chromosome segregation ATPase